MNAMASTFALVFTTWTFVVLYYTSIKEMKEEVVKIMVSLFLTQRLVRIIPQQNHLEPNNLLVSLTKAKNYLLKH